MFFFKNKTVTLDAFTYDEVIKDTAPILPAIRFFPQWMKDLPAEFTEEMVIPESKEIHHIPALNIKSCQGVVDYYKQGFIAPLWTDVSMVVYPDGRYSYTSAEAPFEAPNHPRSQWSGYDNYTHFKIILPWYLEEKTGVKFLIQRPFYTSNSDPVLINKMVPAGGVVDFKNQNTLHMHTFFEKPPFRYEFIMKIGTPIVHIIPLSDKNVNIKLHVISEQEWIKKNTKTTGAKTFTNMSLKKRSIMNALKDESKCPYKW